MKRGLAGAEAKEEPQLGALPRRALLFFRPLCSMMGLDSVENFENTGMNVIHDEKG